MTPTPSDQHAWTTLHLAARTLVDRVTHGAPITLDDWRALSDAVHDVDGVLFSEWWERDRAQKETRA